MKRLYALGATVAVAAVIATPAHADDFLARYGVQENTSANTRYALTGQGTPVLSQRQEEVYGARVSRPTAAPRVVAAQVTEIVCLSNGTCAGRQTTAILN